MLRLPDFDYHAPATVEEAVRVMADAGPEAAYVAGGTDLYPNMKRRQQTPRTVVGVNRIDALRLIEGDPASGLRVGAAVTLTQLAEDAHVRAAYPAVARAAKDVSTPLLQNMGTIGGNLLLDTRCNYYDQTYEWRRSIDFCLKRDGEICWVAPGSPKCWAVSSSDEAPLMVALGARLRFVSPRGEREVLARDLYSDDGILYLHKQPDELLVDIHLPPVNGWRATYLQLRRRGAFDFPVLGVGARVSLAPDGTVESASIVLGAVAPAPVEIEEAARALVGHQLTDESIARAAGIAQHRARPLDNTDFAPHWRKQVVSTYVARALNELRQNKTAGEDA
jgi:4-hydroxybenzoyl-CoA reductase subunit beta